MRGVYVRGCDREGPRGRLLYTKKIAHRHTKERSNRIELIDARVVLAVEPLRDCALAFEAHGPHERTATPTVHNGRLDAIP